MSANAYKMWDMELKHKRKSRNPVFTYENWIDIKELSDKDPKDFTVPTDEEIGKLRVGDYVKVGCSWISDQDEEHLFWEADSFWVELYSVNMQPASTSPKSSWDDNMWMGFSRAKAGFQAANYVVYTGVVSSEVESELAGFPNLGLELGDLISIKDCQIMDIMTPRELKRLTEEGNHPEYGADVPTQLARGFTRDE